jgi:hypothetical protein
MLYLFRIDFLPIWRCEIASVFPVVTIFVMPCTPDNMQRQIQEELSLIMMDNTLTGIVESVLVHIEMKGCCQLHSVPIAKHTKLK